jgi:hypothetical protein
VHRITEAPGDTKTLGVGPIGAAAVARIEAQRSTSVADEGWVIFLRRQVVLIVPDEVHTYWHHRAAMPHSHAGAYRIEDSEWQASFEPRHLTHCGHPGATADFERVARSEGAFFQASARERLARTSAHTQRLQVPR